MESSQSTRLHSIKKVIFFIEQKWNSKVHYLFLFPQTAYKLELDYHLSITNKNPDAKFCRYTNIQSTFIKNAITKTHNSTRSHYWDNKNQNILMKTLKPKSNWIKFNTHKAQILLSHHHSSNPTVKTNTQKRAKFRINRTKNCRNNLPHLNFQPKSHLSKKTRPNFSRQIRNSETGMNSNSLSSSLSHRESENFEFFLFFVFANVWELEFRFSLFLWDFKFPGMRGICRERERERERKRVWSVLVETALDLLRLISP